MFRLQDYIRDYKGQNELGLILNDAQIKRVQEILLDLYKDVIEVCERNGLTILLAGGSALGAVRHKGFIPWDDDMDFLMPRKDYDAFIALFDSELGHKYDLLYPSGEGNSASFFINIVDKRFKKIGMFQNPKWNPGGICIDILSLDYVPENPLTYRFAGCLVNLLYFADVSKLLYEGETELSKRFFCRNFASKMFYHLRRVIGFVLKPISHNRICRWADRLCRGDRKTSRMNIPMGRKHYFGEVLPAEAYLPAREVSFEGVKAYVPNDCDAYLRNLYGDNYMEIPPVEKREYHPYAKIEL